MKSLNQMDLDEWEILPDDGYLEINDDGSGKKIYSRNYNHQGSVSVFEMNYFIDPPKSVEKTEHGYHHHHHQRMMPSQIVPVQIDHVETTNSKPEDDHEVVKKEPTTKIPVEIKIMTPARPETVGSLGSGWSEPDPELFSQVFFKKMKESEFVDMKVESPKSSSARFFQLEEKDGKVDSDMDMDMDLEGSDEDEGGLNIWKWSLNGFGAICSFGVAAATLCIIILSSNHKNHDRHNQKLPFQIYANDKRIRQVVQHASRLNEAMSAVRGVPITRAHITFGGYYDAPL